MLDRWAVMRSQWVMSRGACFASLCGLAIIAGAQGHAQPSTERAYKHELCAGMEREVGLPNGARVDCLSETHAIEVDFTEKWAEALGQALLYAATTGKQPGIILICRQEERLCLQHALRLEEAISYWELPVDVWRHSAAGQP